jgi:hypothetical protein
MLTELLSGFIFWFVIFFFIIIVGNELFTILVNEQLRYLRLIVHYAPLPATACIASGSGPVPQNLSWAPGEKRDPAGSVHIRHAGRIRYGKNGRWMDMGGEAFLSLAVPAFVWHATITYAPGIWRESFDYYVDHTAGTNLNLFSVIPVDNGHTDEIKKSSLFRYLACTPLFPIVYGSSPFIRWENVDDSVAKAVISDGDTAVEAITRFDTEGGIGSIDTSDKKHPVKDRPVPGHYTSRFSSYTEVGGCRIPMEVTSEIILPAGELVSAEYIITLNEFDAPGTQSCGGS